MQKLRVFAINFENFFPKGVFMKNIFRFATVFFIAVSLFSCASNKIKQHPEYDENGQGKREIRPISRNLGDKGTRTAAELAAFFMQNNPGANRDEVARLASLYVVEASTEDINSDCAFAQMCHETGFLTFGNLVVPEMHNYCGLGAIDAEHPGEWFDTEEIGVRAHIQHLQAYAYPEGTPLHNELVDNRYKWVKKGRAPTIFELAGTWAADRQYGEKLDGILTRMENFQIGQ